MDIPLYLTPHKAYENEDQRNVHIWASEPPDSERLLIRLMAGCYTSDRHPIPASTLYEWCQIGYPSFGTKIWHKGTSMCVYLFKVPNDPRQVFSQSEFRISPEYFDAVKSRFLHLPNRNDVMVKEGHYLAFQVMDKFPQELRGRLLVMNDGTTICPFCPEVLKPLFSERQRSPGGTATTSTIRNQNTVTNFHMYYDRNTSPIYRDFNIHQRSIRKDIDQPFNAMFLRADVHEQFDDYQFVIWVYAISLFSMLLPISESAQSGRMWVFEASGAPSLGGQIKFIGHTPRPDNSMLHPDDVSVARASDVFMQHHYETGVLWHFAGGGRRRDTNPIFPCNADDVHRVLREG
ncbi:hypothetical protein IW261DRAFT_1424006 [Armillaria novae-zelandiae]|uniref:HNH nuclease domain-containing protein n=1 Tax=Armillaria novae-zelandiae TaxID=153914 RepID=A0AA39NW96_9AGAR|nr:hypothetical protein IW261DRAFT_1424006 [Armillaria novae-zelandiae]